MISKILICVEDEKHLPEYQNIGLANFLFPLRGYTVGYTDYSVEQINKIEVSNKYVMLNRVLDCCDVDNLKKTLPKLENVKGLVYEDIAVYQLVKDLKLPFELIFYQNHFGTNVNSVNFWLERVDSIFLSNELTIDEITKITKEASSPVCLNLYGYNQVMYSRRKLLSNWSEEFSVPFKNQNTIIDKATKVKFHAVENEYGTVMYSGNIFNGKELLNLDNVKYYYVNPTLIPHEQVMQFFSCFSLSDGEDDGFLHQETIYKLKERGR